MDNYSVQEESKRILHEHLLNDDRLLLPPSIARAAERVRFTGPDSKPFVPTPCKITESSSALAGFISAAASALSADRYGIDFQDVEINTDLATMFLESVSFPTVNGASYTEHPQLMAEVKKGDLYDFAKPIHRQATNIYQTKDGRWYHIHGSMNAAASMAMVDIKDQDTTDEEARKLYMDKIAQNDASFWENKANDELRQAGVTCLTPEEFLATEQGRIMGAEPLWTTRPLPAPRSKWPENPTGASDFKPLAGIRVIDFARVIAAPVISKILAVLGAEVIKVSNKGLPDVTLTWIDLSMGKKDTNIDLKTDAGKKAFSHLVEGADVVIDGYRPGVLARFGFDSKSLREINSRLVYVRENCYGFKGPLAYRSGWQQISDCLVGISWLQGKFMGLDEPIVPLLPNSDYQTGMLGAAAIVVALLQRTKSDTTFDIDASLTQYNIWYYRLGQYNEEQCRALLARNEGFHIRHYDEMSSLWKKTNAAMMKSRPEIFTTPEFFTMVSGSGWEIKEDIRILAPPFKFEKSKIEYIVSSGSRGRSAAEWDT